jgi:type II secretory pathway component GspD/PulD (secretin)
MNRIAGILITLIFFITATASAGMVRFVRAVDGQTIVIDRNGTQVAVKLAGVSVEPEDQAAAREFLEHTLAGSWLLVEGGEEATVYRSPDSFFVNGAMQQHGYVNAGRPRETWLGEADFEPRSSNSRATAPPRRSAPRTYTRTSRRSSAPRRRG